MEEFLLPMYLSTRKQADARIERMRATWRSLTPADVAHHAARADQALAVLEGTRDLSRTW
jgi:hypothetical protein